MNLFNFFRQKIFQANGNWKLRKSYKKYFRLNEMTFSIPPIVWLFFFILKKRQGSDVKGQAWTQYSFIYKSLIKFTKMCGKIPNFKILNSSSESACPAEQVIQFSDIFALFWPVFWHFYTFLVRFLTFFTLEKLFSNIFTQFCNRTIIHWQFYHMNPSKARKINRCINHSGATSRRKLSRFECNQFWIVEVQRSNWKWCWRRWHVRSCLQWWIQVWISQCKIWRLSLSMCWWRWLQMEATAWNRCKSEKVETWFGDSCFLDCMGHFIHIWRINYSNLHFYRT